MTVATATTTIRRLTALAGVTALLGASLAHADNAPSPSPFAKFADPSGVVLAVQTEFQAEGGAVRLSIYGEENFLEEATAKHQGTISDENVAILPIGEVRPGPYAFVAYYDENGDGKLNRGFLGRPKEPYAFSNGVRPKLSKPDFEDAKVDVENGSVIVLTIED